MALNKKLFNTAGEVSITPSQHFQTVLYEGTGATQKVGAYINEGAEFDSGSTSYINLNSLDFPVNDFTVSVWVKLFTVSSSSGYDMILTTAKQNSGGYFYLTFDNNVLTYYETGAGGSVTSSTTVSANQWYHVVLTKSSSDGVKLYLDNVSVGSNSGYTSNNTANTTSGGLNTIGWYNTGSSTTASFDGLMDQFRIFSKALSTSEISTLYGETYSSTSKSVTDIFGDRSAIALYQFENSAKDTGGASGYLGAGAIFDGSSSAITLPTGSFSYTNFSITAWIKQTASDTSDIILENYDYQSSTSRGFIFRVNSGYLRFDGYYSDANVTTATSSSSISLDTWTHVACVFNTSESGADRIKLFINGSETSYSSRSFDSIQYHSTAPTSIGRLSSAVSGSGEQYYTGHIDELRVYDDALTSTELGYIYNNTTASIPTDNLQAYYKFEDNAQDEQQNFDGVSTNVIYKFDGTSSNVSFQGSTIFTPDWIWLKSRTEGTSSYTGNHFIYDSVRGVLKRIKSNSQDSETTFSNSLTAFNSNGFTVGSAIHVNKASDLYVGWCFRGGGSSNTFNINDTGYSTASAASLDGGQATPSGASINTISGLGIYKVNTTTAARTMSHGLPSTPKMYIFKATGKSQNWYVSAYDGSNWKFGNLNTTSQLSTTTTYTADSSNIVIGAGGSTTEVVYAMCDIDNFQKIGTYTGNGDSIGSIVNTDFEVGWLLIKRIDDSSSWTMLDNKRSRTNPRNRALFSEVSDTESTYGGVDFLTNGFQIKATQNNVNGGTYLYWAIAADPSTASTPTVTKSFDVVSYTGNGSTQDIESDIAPDLVWVKGIGSGSSSSGNNVLFDTVRDAGSETDAPHFLSSNLSNAEFGNASTGVVSFNEKGFTVTDDSNGGGNVNGVSGGLYTDGEYIAWLWSAGSHEGNLPTINTEGSTKSTTSVNDASGFSICRFISETNSVVGHGLSAAPELIFVKRLDSTSSWFVYNTVVSGSGRGFLNTTDGFDNSGVPTFSSTTITFQTNDPFSSGADVIMYCFRSISGYSDIGSYVGTGSSISAINVGFQPRFVMIKSTGSTSGGWAVFDHFRSDSSLHQLSWNGNHAQYTNQGVSFTSTGFSPRQSVSSDTNTSGVTYIYFAIK